MFLSRLSNSPGGSPPDWPVPQTPLPAGRQLSAAVSIPPLPRHPGPAHPFACHPANWSSIPAETGAHPWRMQIGTPPPLRPAPVEKPAEAPASPGTESVTLNLIQLMVKRGLISKDDAAGLVQQAEQEAAAAQKQAVAAKTEAPAENPTMRSGRHPSPDPECPGGRASGGGSGDDDSVTVAYVPDVVSNQIRDEVTADVMKQAATRRRRREPQRFPTGCIVSASPATSAHATRAISYPDGNATRAIQSISTRSTPARPSTSIRIRPFLPPTTSTRNATAFACARASARRSTWSRTSPRACASAPAPTISPSRKTRPSAA